MRAHPERLFMRGSKIVLVSFVVLAIAACGGKGKTANGPAAPDKPLYERLGGKPAITAVVDRFVAVTGSDPRISMFFVNVDQARIKSMMVEHICEITGGPCKYTGKSMKESHVGMKVKEEHFAAFMDDLGKVLDEFKVPEREKGEVLGAFNSLKGDVVEP
jgi:hemoglobin